MSAGSTSAPRDRLGRRIIGFAGLPFLSLITPFLFLPILARVAGPEAWLAIAVGQSSGLPARINLNVLDVVYVSDRPLS